MKDQIPNVIRLPYGKGPALFFQAPSWRQLLKLMARLSGTRMEPTLEALADATCNYRTGPPPILPSFNLGRWLVWPCTRCIQCLGYERSTETIHPTNFIQSILDIISGSLPDLENFGPTYGLPMKSIFTSFGKFIRGLAEE